MTTDALALADRLVFEQINDPFVLMHLTNKAAAALRELHAENERLTAHITAADALHKMEGYVGSWYCDADDQPWPCATHRALHPEQDA